VPALSRISASAFSAISYAATLAPTVCGPVGRSRRGLLPRL
jgi:hypothetical protein